MVNISVSMPRGLSGNSDAFVTVPIGIVPVSTVYAGYYCSSPIGAFPGVCMHRNEFLQE